MLHFTDSEILLRMARSDNALKELKWDDQRAEYQATGALFPADQLNNGGLSAYSWTLLDSLELECQCVFEVRCYPGSAYKYSHVALVPESALTPEDDSYSCLDVVEDRHGICDAGKAHVLIRPSGKTQIPSKEWRQTRDRLISRAKVLSKSDLMQPDGS